MIGNLRGAVHECRKDAILIETDGGVGYVVFVSPTTKGKLLSEKEASVHTHTVFKKDTIELFGFLTTEEQSAFLLLLSISGIGPKKAMAMLERVPVALLFGAVRSEDAEALESHGISKKDTQKIILELQKKIEANEKDSETLSDVVVALMALGYSKKEIQPVLKTLNADDTLEQQIQTALRNLL